MKLIISFCFFLFFLKASSQVQAKVPFITAGDYIKRQGDIKIESSTDPAILHDEKLETTGGILTFTNTKLDLRSITLKAKKIIITAAITEIIIGNDVKFECEDLNITTPTDGLLISYTGYGSLNFLHSHSLTVNGKIIQQPADGHTFTIGYKKMN